MIHIQESCNLFVGDTGPDNSKHLTLNGISLPTLEEFSQTHYGGGVVGEIEVGGLGLKKLEVTFKLAGYDPQVMSQFGLNQPGRMPFTVYGLIRDKANGRDIELKAIMQARLGKIQVDEFKRGDLLGHDHMLHEIWHYEVYYDGVEKWFYDFLTSAWRVDGVDHFARHRNILRIPSGAA